MSIKKVFKQHFKLVFNDHGQRECQCGYFIGNGGNTGKLHKKHAIQVLEQHEREREAAAEAKHRREWADHISEWHATVGAPICHVDAVVQALRSDHVPFGKGATNGRD